MEKYDFENLNGLRDLINAYKGTLLVVTHSRYLLAHCFDRIWHLENGDLQEYEGNFTEYSVLSVFRSATPSKIKPPSEFANAE